MILLEGNQSRVLCDPWVTFDRQAPNDLYNFPESHLSRDDVASIKPDFIYITHTHLRTPGLSTQKSILSLIDHIISGNILSETKICVYSWRAFKKPTNYNLIDQLVLKYSLSLCRRTYKNPYAHGAGQIRPLF